MKYSFGWYFIFYNMSKLSCHIHIFAFLQWNASKNVPQSVEMNGVLNTDVKAHLIICTYTSYLDFHLTLYSIQRDVKSFLPKLSTFVTSVLILYQPLRYKNALQTCLCNAFMLFCGIFVFFYFVLTSITKISTHWDLAEYII